jgi:hypothetical protein
LIKPELDCCPYLAAPVHVDGKDYDGQLHEASDVIPIDCESSHRPPDYADRRRNTTYAKEAKQMSRIDIRAGQMLAIAVVALRGV